MEKLQIHSWSKLHKHTEAGTTEISPNAARSC